MKLADSSCLICIFNEINRPFILMDWIKKGYQIIITEQVYKELQKNKKTSQKVNPEISKGAIEVKNIIMNEDLQKLKNRYPALAEGELSIILTAIELNKLNKKYYAVIDDLKARKVAADNNVNLTGTYGLLKQLVEKELINIEEFNNCKEAMKNSKFRINFGKIK